MSPATLAPDRPVLPFVDDRLPASASREWRARLAYAAADIEALRQRLAEGGPPAFAAEMPDDRHVALVGRVAGAWCAAPGRLSAEGFAADCSSDGFEPGAVLLSLATGEALGVLAAPGRYERRAGTAADDGEESLEKFAVTPTADLLADRRGYDPRFLGIAVPLPEVSNHADVASFAAPGGGRSEVLAYTHYSVVMSRSRRLPLFAACNIDGRRLLKLTRKEGSDGSDRWYFDPRLDKALQVGPKVYAGSHCDKGHMVRRLDPVWGDEAEARRANDETFFYTNACPQHRDLNRKTWSDLEDFIYEQAGAHKLKLSVFTGPVLAQHDVAFRGVQAPTEFWKVVVTVDKGRLSASAYLQSQVDLLGDLEFVFGEFKTYQIEVAEVERRTGLNFGKLRERDPMRRAGGRRTRALESVAQDVVLQPPPVDGLQEAFAELNTALKRLDQEACAEICGRVIEDIHGGAYEVQQDLADKMLQNLRAQRFFGLMQQLADALISTQQASIKAQRLYAQALIDQGNLSAARFVLKPITEPPVEYAEAMGLLGRIDKQLYVNHANPAGRHVASLERAYHSYWKIYASDKSKTWHGINVVAILARAERDRLALAAAGRWREIAGEILQTLKQREADAPDGLNVWDCATVLEALVARDELSAATTQALGYVGMPGATAFELSSTARQLEELWCLDERGPEWGSILTLLRAETLRHEGAVSLSPAVLRSDLQKTFGNEGSRSLPWYLNGLKRCKSVARIEQAGKGVGTGWLVSAADFVPGMTGLLLMTNAHVVAPGVPERPRGALLPGEARANFQGLGLADIAIGEVLCWSGVEELDYALLTLAPLPAEAEPMPLAPAPIAFSESKPPRLYVIGHPQGRDVEFSLQDNVMLGQDERVLHYRTPTEPGSSGSPVFDPDEWRVLALHHAGREQMQRLDGRGRYQANEGISIHAIQRHAHATARAG